MENNYRSEEEINRERYRNNRKNNMNMVKNKSGFLTLILSMIPGAGHMYLGYMNKGIVIMASFMIISGITGWLSLPIIGFILPIIWFYSIFDAMNLRNYPEDDMEDLSELLPDISYIINSKYLGWGLIFLGVIMIIQKLIMPIISEFLTWKIINMFQTLIVSGVFILGGFKLLGMNKDEYEEDDDMEKGE